MAILTACGSSADNSQKQETIVKQPEATSMTVELDENVSEQMIQQKILKL